MEFSGKDMSAGVGALSLQRLVQSLVQTHGPSGLSLQTLLLNIRVHGVGFLPETLTLNQFRELLFEERFRGIVHVQGDTVVPARQSDSYTMASSRPFQPRPNPNQHYRTAATEQSYVDYNQPAYSYNAFQQQPWMQSYPAPAPVPNSMFYAYPQQQPQPQQQYYSQQPTYSGYHPQQFYYSQPMPQAQRFQQTPPNRLPRPQLNGGSATFRPSPHTATYPSSNKSKITFVTATQSSTQLETVQSRDPAPAAVSSKSHEDIAPMRIDDDEEEEEERMMLGGGDDDDDDEDDDEEDDEQNQEDQAKAMADKQQQQQQLQIDATPRKQRESFQYQRPIVGGHVNEFGVWEQHTRGIGLKLMKQMGYKQGKGLGRDESGTVDLIQVQMLPARRALDFLDEGLQKKEIKQRLRQARRIAERVGLTSQQETLLRTAVKQVLAASGGEISLEMLHEALNKAQLSPEHLDFPSLQDLLALVPDIAQVAVDEQGQYIAVAVATNNAIIPPEQVASGEAMTKLRETLVTTLQGRGPMSFTDISLKLQAVGLTPKLFRCGTLSKLLNKLPDLVTVGVVNDRGIPKKVVWLNSEGDSLGESTASSAPVLKPGSIVTSEDWNTLREMLISILREANGPVALNEISLKLLSNNLSPKRFGFSSLSKLIDSFATEIQTGFVDYQSYKCAWLRRSVESHPHSLPSDAQAQAQDWQYLREFLVRLLRQRPGEKMAFYDIGQALSVDNLSPKRFGCANVSSLLAKFPEINTGFQDGIVKVAWLNE